MTVYSGPVFDMAVNQFGVIANHLEIPMDERDRILMPKRAITVSCPIHRDDGTVAVYVGSSAVGQGGALEIPGWLERTRPSRSASVPEDRRSRSGHKPRILERLRKRVRRLPELLVG